MHWLFILTLKSILSSIIGSSFYQWFKNTKMGVWFQVRLDNLMEWVAKRYDIEIASREEKWLAQYPLLAKRIVDLEKEVAKLKKKNHKIINLGPFSDKSVDYPIFAKKLANKVSKNKSPNLCLSR